MSQNDTNSDLKDNSKMLNAVVVGVGYLGKIHAKIYHNLPHVNLLGVYDTNPSQAKEVADLYGCKVFESIQSIATNKQVDAVSIVVPTTYHYQVAKPFIENKIAVLLEKPIAANIEEAQMLVDLANKHKSILQIGHLERFNAGIEKLTEIIDNPRFIEAHRLGKFTIRATDVDVVTDLMIHDIDLVLMMVKSPVERISASGTSVITNKIDIANVRLEFENGAVANLTSSRVSEKQFRRMRVFAEDKYAAADLNSQSVEVLTKQSVEGELFPTIKKEIIDIKPVQPLDEEIKHFLEVIKQQGVPKITGLDGLSALKIAEQICQDISERNARYK